MAWPKGLSRAEWSKGPSRAVDELKAERAKAKHHRNGSLRVRFCPFCGKVKPLAAPSLRFCIYCQRAFNVVKVAKP